jgi:hypothetical protein
MMSRIGEERGWPPVTRAHFDREAGPNGALCVGSPETVAAKIVRTVRALGLSRFDMKYSSGTLPHDLLMQSIELYGSGSCRSYGTNFASRVITLDKVSLAFGHLPFSTASACRSKKESASPCSGATAKASPPC